VLFVAGVKRRMSQIQEKSTESSARSFCWPVGWHKQCDVDMYHKFLMKYQEYEKVQMLFER
jgi:hypothetical protein